MDPTKIIARHKRLSASSREHIAGWLKAPLAEDLQNIKHNYSSIIKDTFDISLMYWRMSDDCTPSELRNTVETACQAFEACEKFPKPSGYCPDYSEDAMECVGYAQYILGVKVENQLIDLMCRGLHSESASEKNHWIGFMGRKVGLLQYLLTDAKPYYWTEVLVHCGENKKLNLELATYTNYCELIEAIRSGRSDSDVIGLIHKAEDLYARRAKDRWYKELGYREGGGDYNAIEVDFRLGAILQLAKGPDGLSRFANETIHAWKWTV